MCDGKNTWRRKQYPEYKAGREPDVYEPEKREATDTAIRFFEECTNAMVLRVPGAEADDLIAVWCRHSRGVNNIIMSTDKDFEQLVDEHTSLYSPTQKKFRTSETREYDLFEKCIRGDKGDNLPSAFPRVRSTRLKAAWEDPVEMQNLMEETPPVTGVKVFDQYEFNRKMIDLSLIPPMVEQQCLDAIQNAPKGNFSDMRMLRFLTEVELKKHADMMEPYHRYLKGRPVFQV